MGPLLSVVLTFGDPSHCAPLVEQLKTLEFQVPDLPTEVTAGVSTPFQIEARKPFVLDAGHYDLEYSSVTFLGETDLPYPAALRLDQDDHLLTFLFSAEPSLSQTFVAEPRPSFGGDLKLLLHVVLFDTNHRYCMVDGELDRRLTVHSERLDVTPPLLTGIAFDKTEYHAGDTATATFTLSEPLRQLTTDHVEFGEGESGFPGYLSNSVYTLVPTDAANTYQLTFVVPESTPAGDHVLAWFNRYDRQDNFEDQVGAVDPNEKAVAQSHPLRVVSGN